MANEQHPVSEMVEAAVDKIKEVLGSDTAVGKPVEMPNGVTAVPICKVSFAFGSGGSDLTKRENAFGGGMAGGVKVTPVAFLVSAKEGVKILQLDTVGSTADNIVRTVPDVVDKIVGLFSKDTPTE